MLISRESLQTGRSWSALTLAALIATGCHSDDTGGDGDSGDDATTTATDTPTTTVKPSATDTGSGEESDSTAADETVGSGCELAPGEWAAPEWEANTVEALALRAQLDALAATTMRGIENGEIMLGGVSDLTDLWDGDPSLAAVANPGYLPIVEASFDQFVDLIAAGSQELVDGEGNWDPGPAGGIWADDNRGINEGGLEVRQLVDKAGFAGGVFYAYALGLTEGEIDAATIDAIAAAWGNNAELDPEGELTDAANYSYLMGFHGQMAEALTAAKAYAEDETCEAERDEALVTFFNLWEQTAYARLVFYGNRAQGKLLAAESATELSDVLHDLAEGLGIAAGFVGLPDPKSGPLSGQARTIRDADVIAIMDAFGVNLDDLGGSTTGLLVESLPNFEAAVDAAEGVIMEVYGIDQVTIMSYVMPTPG